MSAVSVASSARSTGLPPAAFLQTLPPAALAAVQPGKEMTDDEARKLVPAEVVAEINDLNAEDLAGRREEWAQAERSVDGRSRLQMAAAARNAELVANYEDAVADVYADSFVMEVVCTAAVRSAVNEMMFRAIEDAYLAAKATVAAENARLAALHAAEVAEKKARDKEYMAALAKWEADRATIMALHKEQVAKAAEAHKAAVVRQQRTWEQRKADTEAANAARLEASRAEYDAEVAAIKEHNKAAKAEYAEVIKARRSCEKENAIRLAEAKAAHREALEQLGRDNEQRLEDSQVEHAELCERMKVRPWSLPCSRHRLAGPLRAAPTLWLTCSDGHACCAAAG